MMQTPEQISEEVLANCTQLGDLGLAITKAIEVDRLQNGNLVMCPRCKSIKDMEDEYPATAVPFSHLRVGEEGDDAEYVKLTKTYALLIERLVAHRPMVQTYETLIFHIWEGGTLRPGGDKELEAPGAILKVMMCKIRPLFDALKRHTVRIDTTWGVGYSIHADTTLTMVTGVPK